MRKKHFITLIICVISGLLFSLGMCMCLLPEWDSFTLGVVLTSIGGIALVTMGIIAYAKNSKNKTPINWKLVGKISYAVISALILGLGMCMIMVWNLMIWGVIVGISGIIMLLFLIPMCLGFKESKKESPKRETLSLMFFVITENKFMQCTDIFREINLNQIRNSVVGRIAKRTVYRNPHLFKTCYSAFYCFFHILRNLCSRQIRLNTNSLIDKILLGIKTPWL